MTNIVSSIRTGSSAKTAGRLSMISVLAITAGIAAAPAQAQSMADPLAVQPPVAAPTPAPVPVTQPAPVTIVPETSAEAITPVTSDRADALATKGGFDATTVAPEALAQIEREQQARKDAAAKAAADAKAAAASARAAAVASKASASSAPSVDAAESMVAAPVVDPAPVAGFDSAPAAIQPAPVSTPAPAAVTGNDGPGDWTLLAALAGLLGLGGVGAFAASRRRKSKAQPVAAEYVAYKNEPKTAAVTAATMPELREEPVQTEEPVQPVDKGAAAKAHLTDFIEGLPSFDEPRSRADHNIPMGQRRVAAAPRPYLGEADLARRPGYFTAHVDGIPTPENPFLTRQKRLKRARYLDAKLAGMKASETIKPTRVSGTMQVTRPLEPAYS